MHLPVDLQRYAAVHATKLMMMTMLMMLLTLIGVSADDTDHVTSDNPRHVSFFLSYFVINGQTSTVWWVHIVQVQKCPRTELQVLMKY